MPVLGSSGGTPASVIPPFTAKPTVTVQDAALSRIGGKIGPLDTITLPGFSEDGDYIQWNTSQTGSNNKIEYYNNADSLQWTVNETDVNASAEGIAFICKVGSLIYGVAKDLGTTDGYVFTVNSSGTVNNLATITLNSSSDSDYHVDDCWLGKIYGGANLYFTSAGNNEGIEINPATGTVVASSTGGPSFSSASFLTSLKISVRINTQSIIFNGIQSGSAFEVIGYVSSTYHGDAIARLLQFNCFGASAVNFWKYIYWDGTMYPVGIDYGSSGPQAMAGYSQKDVDDYFVSIIDQFGLNAPATWS